MRLIDRVLPLAACALALGACHSSAYLRKHAKAEQCIEHPAYLAAQSAPALHTPDGLAAPNTKNALRIAEVTGTPAPRTTKEGCLDKPPNFFADQAKPSAGGAKRPDPPMQ
jgi:uncharacterized lipoprotein